MSLTKPFPFPLTLIFAATTKSLGIGKNGILPWKLKSEMSYFTRITRHVPPPQIRARTPPPTEIDLEEDGEILPTEIDIRYQEEGEKGKLTNAVIMGRKTWESIPTKYRPLQGRINIVITRQKDKYDNGEKEEGPYYVSSLEEALEFVNTSSSRIRIHNVFVIGGAEIYKLAMKSPWAKYILFTEILGKEERWECDTFFPVEFRNDGEGGKWVKRDHETLEKFGGSGNVPKGIQREGDVEFDYQMWEKV